MSAQMTLVEPWKKGPETLFRVYIGDAILPSYMGIIINHYEDPYYKVPKGHLTPYFFSVQKLLLMHWGFWFHSFKDRQKMWCGFQQWFVYCSVALFGDITKNAHIWWYNTWPGCPKSIFCWIFSQTFWEKWGSSSHQHLDFWYRTHETCLPWPCRSWYLESCWAYWQRVRELFAATHLAISTEW